MNIKTTVAGVIAAVSSVVSMFVPGFEAITQPVTAIAVFLIGLFAKDANPIKAVN